MIDKNKNIMDKFEHLNDDYSNVPKSIGEFKSQLSDVYLENPNTREGIGNMFEKFSKHPNEEVSKAAREFLEYYRNELLIKLGNIDNNNYVKKEVLKVANNSEYDKNIKDNSV